ncbi:cyclic pyranopterin monophosphate synthase [Aureococcus anophagefferens]|nr:cyclic pyranopterin monophosphate synthase [Aureococcus anophagefferens]
MIRTRRYHATHMSNRYRNNPLTDLTGPFVPGKGQSYFRVEFLANTKAHNYVLSRLRRVLNSMQTHAEERTNAADGTPGRCLATLEELVNKAATQKLICPTTKAGDGDTARSHPFQASPERPDDRLADYSMNTYFLSVLAANVSCAGAWGKPDWYFFEVVCGRSDTVVDCGMTTVPETYALKQPAAHRDLRELLRQGKLPPPLPAEDPPAKRSRVVEPSATPADAAPPAPAQAATSGPPPAVRGARRRRGARPRDAGVLRRPAGRAERCHVDASTARPRMVDVGGKAVTARRAVASCRVVLPAGAWDELSSSGFASKKGPVLTTAVIAGVQGAKRTHELVPFCHSVALDGCDVAFEADDAARALDITCSVATSHRTGVEMEALTGCSVAALAVYDMCKALSHDIEITNLRLLEKSGGKADFKRG